MVRRRPDVEWSLDEAALAYDRRSDGMYPLLTSDTSLTNAQVLEAHKGQPRIEKRFQQTKAVHEIAPVFLRNEVRVEALFTFYFLGLLLQALIERELRQAMVREKIDHRPLYPEERRCNKQPSTERVLRLFSLAERHTLSRRDTPVQVFHPELTDLQNKVLDLLSVPAHAFRV
jgi:transposase